MRAFLLLGALFLLADCAMTKKPATALAKTTAVELPSFAATAAQAACLAGVVVVPTFAQAIVGQSVSFGLTNSCPNSLQLTYNNGLVKNMDPYSYFTYSKTFTSGDISPAKTESVSVLYQSVTKPITSIPFAVVAGGVPSCTASLYQAIAPIQIGPAGQVLGPTTVVLKAVSLTTEPILVTSLSSHIANSILSPSLPNTASLTQIFTFQTTTIGNNSITVRAKTNTNVEMLCVAAIEVPYNAPPAQCGLQFVPDHLTLGDGQKFKVKMQVAYTNAAFIDGYPVPYTAYPGWMESNPNTPTGAGVFTVHGHVDGPGGGGDCTTTLTVSNAVPPPMIPVSAITELYLNPTQSNQLEYYPVPDGMLRIGSLLDCAFFAQNGWRGCFGVQGFGARYKTFTEPNDTTMVLRDIYIARAGAANAAYVPPGYELIGSVFYCESNTNCYYRKVSVYRTPFRDVAVNANDLITDLRMTSYHLNVTHPDGPPGWLETAEAFQNAHLGSSPPTYFGNQLFYLTKGMKRFN